MDVRSDTGLYVGVGLFTILVFVVAMGLLVVTTDVDLDGGTLPTFVVGFLLFMGSYFVAMAVYLGVERFEESG